MADVFISYAREDKPDADRIAGALKSAGYDVFWDSEIPPGQTWADYIEGKLSSAKIAVVLWSATSTKSQWVREEARMGRDRGKLIPVMIDATPAPFGFGEVQAADLSNWTGDLNDPRWQRFAAAVELGVQRPAAPPPPPPPPPPQAPPPPPPQAPPQSMFSFASTAGAQPNPQQPWLYVQKCLRLYVTGAGRARRLEFWCLAIFNFIVFFIAGMADVSSGVNPYTSAPNSLLMTGLAALALVCPTVSLWARRLHDVGLNGWLAALGLIPYLGWLFMLVIGFVPGQAGENKYGPDPKAA